MLKFLINISKLIITLIIVAAVSIYFTLKNSLATLNGEITANVENTVTVERDQAGIATINAANRADLSYALGYLHAQERFFQMDLLRRNSAGELSELFGKLALEHDKNIRVHQFRERAEQYARQLAPEHTEILNRYTDGINQGLKDLTARPFEYFLLNKTPRAWRPADSLLVLYSMYIDLQYEDGARERLLGHLQRNLLPDVFTFLTPKGSIWDAAIDGTTFSSPAIPENKLAVTPILNLLSQQLPTRFWHGDEHEASRGSNNWAVSGNITAHRSAIVDDDMHLGIGVPNIWYRAGLRYGEGASRVAVDGVTLPGVPAVVVGSNRHIAWGFTNSYGDWNDVIRLTLDESGQQYQTPSGYLNFDIQSETILIANDHPTRIEIKSTIWGPVIGRDHDGSLLALRWVAHDADGINFDLLEMEKAQDLTAAIKVANGAGIPAQNIVIGDKDGNIAWTIAGAMPNKLNNSDKPSDIDWQVPADWSKGQFSWQGYLPEAAYPKIINPKHDRIWTANSRVVGGEDLKKIGNGGYALGARSHQIKAGLMAKKQFDEASLFAIQNDDRAEFLARWQAFVVDEILTDEFVASHQLDDLKGHIENWGARASIDSVGYLFIRQFRLTLRDSLFALFQNDLHQSSRHNQANLRLIRHQLEVPMWLMVTEQPTHLLPKSYPDWTAFLRQMVLTTQQQLIDEHGSLSAATWGAHNTTKIQHPLSKAIPALSWLLDMPSLPASGDSYMPRVQGKSFGASQRMVVSPGQEAFGIMQMPSGQAAHPLSPYFGEGHDAWIEGTPTPFLPGPTKYVLTFMPQGAS